MHIVTANRLADGLAVFRGDDGRWRQAIAAAALLEGPAAVEVALESAFADAKANRVVDPYAIEVVVPAAGGAPVPTRLRERIRSSGPTAGHSLARPDRQAA